MLDLLYFLNWGFVKGAFPLVFICPLDVKFFKNKFIMGVYPNYFQPVDTGGVQIFGQPTEMQKGDLFKNPTSQSDQYDDLQQKIINSPAYQTALQIFSSDARYGTPYLNQLKMIPFAYQSADRTGLDNINWSNRADDKDQANYNDAITQIRNLVNNYYTFVNTLPKSQLAQSLEAGYNLGILGGINNSSQDSLEASPSPANQLQSTQALEQVSSAVATGINVVSSITSAVSGIAGVYKAFNDVAIAKGSLGLQTASLALNEAQFVNTMVKSLVDKGFEIEIGSINNVQDLNDFLAFASRDPISAGVREGALKTWYDNTIANTPYRAYLEYGDDGTMFFSPEKLFVDAGKRRHPNKTPQQILELYAQYKMDAYLLGIEKEKFMSKFEFDYASVIDGSEAGETYNATNVRTQVEEGYKTLENELKHSYLSKYADMFKNSNDPSTKFAVLQVLYDMGLDDQAAAELVGLVGSPSLSKVIQDNYKDVATEILKRIDPNRYQQMILQIFKDIL